MVNITLVGRLTQDPQQNDTAQGYHFTRFGVAATTHRKDAEGNYITNFYNANMIGASGDVIARNFHKGDGIILTGNLLIREYVATDGTKRNSFDIDVRDFAFPPTRNSNGGNGQAAAQPTSNAAPAQYTPVNADDDLPF